MGRRISCHRIEISRSAVCATALLVCILLVIINVFLYLRESIHDYVSGLLHFVYFPVLTAFILGLIHGFIPHEHTWPITISYAVSQADVRRGVAAAFIFASSLTAVWSLISEAISLMGSVFLGSAIDRVALIITGIVMVLVGLLVLRRGLRYSCECKLVEMRLPYRYIWIHGTAAAFGSGCLVVAVYTLALITSPAIGWCLGLSFGLGNIVAQLLVAYAAVRLSLSASRYLRAGDVVSVLGVAGTLALTALGAYLLVYGMTVILIGS